MKYTYLPIYSKLRKISQLILNWENPRVKTVTSIINFQSIIHLMLKFENVIHSQLAYD